MAVSVGATIPSDWQDCSRWVITAPAYGNGNNRCGCCAGTLKRTQVASCRGVCALIVLYMSCSTRACDISCRYIKVLAHKKVSKGWGEVLVQGIFANWLGASPPGRPTQRRT